MTKPQTPQTPKRPFETHPPIRLDEVQGLTDAQRAESRARLQRGETFHVVDPVSKLSRRVIL